MKRIYTEIRIHHKSVDEKEHFERQLDNKAKTTGFSSRAEYIRVLVTNASIRVATERQGNGGFGMKKNEFAALKNWFEKKYGTSSLATIECDGRTIQGYMYGNDECFDGDEFYQYFLTEDVLYKAYYAIPEGVEDLSNLDYDHPYKLVDADAQYYIDYVI